MQQPPYQPTAPYPAPPYPSPVARPSSRSWLGALCCFVVAPVATLLLFSSLDRAGPLELVYVVASVAPSLAGGVRFLRR